MIGFLRGSAEHIADNFSLIECNGVGYKVYMTTDSLQKLPKSPGTAKIFTFMYMKEDIITLYGFLSLEEQEFFELLISVNGVGPKAAMALLSVASPSQLAVCIASEDTDMLSTAPGIGKKTAQRMVLELKGKIKRYSLPPAMQSQRSIDTVSSGAARDAADALVSLGYSRSEAVKAVAETDIDLPVEKIIKTALKKIIENR